MIDCFSKWSEIVPLDKESITIAKTFFENVIYRCGKPQLVRFN